MSGLISKRRILLADEHTLLRERLVELLNAEHDLLVCGEAVTAAATLGAIDSLRLQLVVLEIALPGSYGTSLVRDIHDRKAELPVLVLSQCDESLYASRAIRAGARGYIHKRESARAVIAAIHCVLEGHVYASEAVKDALLCDAANGGRGSGQSSTPSMLSDQEWEVFQRLGWGMGPSQIAAELRVSVRTVEGYMDRIKQKLALRSARELHREALEHARIAPHLQPTMLSSNLRSTSAL